MAAAWNFEEPGPDNDGDMQLAAAAAMDFIDEVNDGINAEITASQDAASAAADLDAMLVNLDVLESEQQIRENDRLNFEAMIRSPGMYQLVNAAQPVYLHVRRANPQEHLSAGTRRISITSTDYAGMQIGIAGESTLGHELAELLRPMDPLTEPSVKLELFGDLQIGCFREFAFAPHITHISIIGNSIVNVLDFSNVGPAVAVEVRDCPNLIRVRSRGVCNLYGCWSNVVCTRNLTPLCEESLNLSVEQEGGFRQYLVESYASVFGYQLVQCRNYYGLIEETFEIVPATDGDENTELIGDALARVANLYTTEKKWTLKLTGQLSIGSLVTICAAFRDWSIVVENNIDLKVLDTRNTGVHDVTVRLCEGLRYAVASHNVMFTAKNCWRLGCIVSPLANSAFVRAHSCARLTDIIDSHRVECEMCPFLTRLPRRVGPGSRIVVGPACPLVRPPVIETIPVFWPEALQADYLEQHPLPLDGPDLPRWAQLENRVIGVCDTWEERIARRTNFFGVQHPIAGSYVYDEMATIPLVILASRDMAMHGENVANVAGFDANPGMQGGGAAGTSRGSIMAMELAAFERRQQIRGITAMVSLRRRNGALPASSTGAASATPPVAAASMPYAPPKIERHILQFLLNPPNRPS